MLNTCLGFVSNLQDAEDICQEVFVDVFRSMDTFEEASSLSTWIYRIATNKCLSFIRYRKRQKRAAFFKSLIGLDQAESLQVPDDSFHPGLSLENQERGKILFEKIRELPEKQQTAFVLNRVEGLEITEVASIMNSNRNAVDALLNRASRNLRKKLEAYYTNEE